MIFFFVVSIKGKPCHPPKLSFLAAGILLRGFVAVLFYQFVQFFTRILIIRRCADALKIGRMGIFTSWLYFSISDYLITLNGCGALRVVHLHPTSSRNSLYTLNLNIFFVFPYIPACRFLFSAFLSFSSTNNIYGTNPCLSSCFPVRWVFSNKISIQIKLYYWFFNSMFNPIIISQNSNTVQYHICKDYSSFLARDWDFSVPR